LLTGCDIGVGIEMGREIFVRVKELPAVLVGFHRPVAAQADVHVLSVPSQLLFLFIFRPPQPYT
jgi:hypothetical protein